MGVCLLWAGTESSWALPGPAIDFKKMFLGYSMDCSHHGVKQSDAAAAHAGVPRQIGFPL
jgi:hypothetical protein